MFIYKPMIRFPEWFSLKKHNENIDIPFWLPFYDRFYDEYIITVDVFGDNGCPGRMGYGKQVTVTTTYMCKYYAVCQEIRWLAVSRIYVALAVFQPYRDLEVGDNQSLKS